MTASERAKLKRIDKRRDALLSDMCVIKTWLSFPLDAKSLLFHIGELVTREIEKERRLEAEEKERERK